MIFTMRLLPVVLLCLLLQAICASGRVTHVALACGCHSHFNMQTSTIHTLVGSPNHRVTVVTAPNCKPKVDRLNATIFSGPNTNWGVLPSRVPPSIIAEIRMHLGSSKELQAENEAALAALEELVSRDRPDVILSDHFTSGGASTAGDTHAIPVAIHLGWGGANIGLPDEYKIAPGMESMPIEVQALVADGIELGIEFLLTYIMRGCLIVGNSRRGTSERPHFNGFHHMLHSYPLYKLTGPPFLYVARETESVRVFGTLPEAPSSTETFDKELMDFISRSSKPILYIAMGSHFAFTDEQFHVMKRALLEQDYFNIIWSHSGVDSSEKFPSKFLVRGNFPQSDLLAQEKVRVFWTHGGLNSYLEGVLSGTVMIGNPQGRDNFVNCKNIDIQNIGVVIKSSPTEREILQILENVNKNLKAFQDNLQKLLNSNDFGKSTKAFLGFLDELAETKKSSFIAGRTGGLNETLIMAVRLTLLVLASCMGLIIVRIISCVCWRRGSKQKTS